MTLPTKASADIIATPFDPPAAPEEKRCEKCLCIYCCCPVTAADLERAEEKLKQTLEEIEELRKLPLSHFRRSGEVEKEPR